MKCILEVKGSNNDEILIAWPYGKALERLGDDQSIKELLKHIHSPELLQNTKFWLIQIIHELEKNWQKTTREWPQPWVSFDGLVQQGQGLIIDKDGKETIVYYDIWQKYAPDPAQYHYLKGIAFSPGRPFFDWLNAENIRLRLEDGTEGKILITQSLNESFIFSSAGPFSSGS